MSSLIKESNTSIDSDDGAFLCPIKRKPPTIEENLSKKIKFNSKLKNKVPKATLSKFFNVTPKPKDVLQCVLCSKSFENSSVHISHMKQCAKKKNMTTAQLLVCVEANAHLLENNGQENPTKSKIGNEENFDEAMHIALSRSLSDDSDTQSIGVDNAKAVAAQKVTLEKFGFTKAGLRKHKAGQGGLITTLLKRTQEERKQIIIEKASIIILDENRSENIICDDFAVNYENPLWNLGASNTNTDWLIGPFKNLHSECAIEKPILNLKLGNILDDWGNMVNNSHLSDITLKTADSSPIYAHRFVLEVRCPGLLALLRVKSNKCAFDSLLPFLHYIYTGLTTPESVDTIKQVCSILGCSNLEVEQFTPSESTQPYDGDRDLFDTENTKSPEVSIIAESYREEQYELNELEKAHNSLHEAEISRNEEFERDNLEDAKAREEELNRISVIMDGEVSRSHSYMSSPYSDEGSQCKKIKVQKEENFTDIIDLEEEEYEEKTKICKKENVKLEDDSIVLIDVEEEALERERNSQPSLDSSKPMQTLKNYESFSTPLNKIREEVSDCKVESFKREDEEHQFENWFEPPPFDDNFEYYAPVESPIRNCSTPVMDNDPIPQHSSTPIGNSSYLQSSKKISFIRNQSNLLRRSVSILNNKYRKKMTGGEQELLSKSIVACLEKSFNVSVRDVPSVSAAPKVLSELGLSESFTPKPNYSTMNPELLKKHLANYGLKRSLSRNKAIKILTHIYDELHPLIDTTTGKVIKSDAPNNKNKDSDAGNAEEFGFLEKDKSASPQKIQKGKDLHKSFKILMENDKDLHRRILLYEPISIEQVQYTLLKRYLERYTLTEIMDYLDSKCVVFISEAQRMRNAVANERKKRRKDNRKKMLHDLG